ncbi:2-dehydropantoate 2-reductase [Fontisphaera persica]|uniref:2-dehydropantoate 2-reductase n=1 Tax=Fontisphaera persica TaxID=2974023 RepID=UPI0024BFF963|nr:2-dehydropantoate 2-reductase [Fontisphaera persica]WCJ60824.1 2-dehydropantoate 2-reductase [Fontisphaera persica]
MKAAVVGCGAVGSFYGGLLHRTGVETHFLLRSDFAVVAAQGVHIQSVQGDWSFHPHAARRPEEIGPCDLVVIALKATANREAYPALLPPLLGPDTLLLTLQNGLGNVEALAALAGPEKVLGGLCFVCLNRIAPGIIRHLAHGRVMLGEFQRPALPRTHALAAHFRQGGVPCEVIDDLNLALWKKLVWNIPFNGLGVAAAAGYEAVIHGHWDSSRPLGSCLPTRPLLEDPRWLALVRELMLEVIHAARKQGLDIPESWADENIERTRVMGDYYASTLLDFAQGRPLELEALFLEPYRRACAARAECPRLGALCRLLQQLEAARQPPATF